MTSFTPNHLFEALSQNTVTMGVRLSMYELGGGAQNSVQNMLAAFLS